MLILLFNADFVVVVVVVVTIIHAALLPPCNFWSFEDYPLLDGERVTAN